MMQPSSYQDLEEEQSPQRVSHSRTPRELIRSFTQSTPTGRTGQGSGRSRVSSLLSPFRRPAPPSVRSRSIEMTTPSPVIQTPAARIPRNTRRIGGNNYGTLVESPSSGGDMSPSGNSLSSGVAQSSNAELGEMTPILERDVQRQLDFGQYQSDYPEHSRNYEFESSGASSSSTPRLHQPQTPERTPSDTSPLIAQSRKRNFREAMSNAGHYVKEKARAISSKTPVRTAGYHFVQGVKGRLGLPTNSPGNTPVSRPRYGAVPGDVEMQRMPQSAGAESQYREFSDVNAPRNYGGANIQSHYLRRTQSESNVLRRSVSRPPTNASIGNTPLMNRTVSVKPTWKQSAMRFAARGAGSLAAAGATGLAMYAAEVAYQKTFGKDEEKAQQDLIDEQNKQLNALFDTPIMTVYGQQSVQSEVAHYGEQAVFGPGILGAISDEDPRRVMLDRVVPFPPFKRPKILPVETYTSNDKIDDFSMYNDVPCFISQLPVYDHQPAIPNGANFVAPMSYNRGMAKENTIMDSLKDVSVES